MHSVLPLKMQGQKFWNQFTIWMFGFRADRMGDVMSDLQGRRALIMGMGSERGYEKITARVPLKGNEQILYFT